MLRRIRLVVATMWVCALLLPSSAEALSTIPSPPVVPTADSPIIITGYSFQAGRLGYIQLFNESDEVVSLDGWQLQYQTTAGSVSLPPDLLGGLLAPSRYAIAADLSVLPSTTWNYTLPAPLPTDTDTVEGISLLPPTASSYRSETVDVPNLTAGTLYDATAPPTYYFARGVSTSTGNYLSGFDDILPGSHDLYMDELYVVPASTLVEISEIMPHARNCSPLDDSSACHDYVKLHNPSTASINLADFRLRSGYKGQSATSSNTFYLSGNLAAGHYASYPVDLTNSGGWVWFEDTYGLKRYDNTVTSYPSASSQSRTAQAWAYDESDGEWKWTTSLTPTDSPSRFTSPPTVVTTTSSSLQPCASNQFRNPATNRCKLLASTASGSSLTPCKAGQYRNPATNRCRSLTTASGNLKPCDPGEERNPATNRCRDVLGASIPSADFKPQPTSESGSGGTLGWLTFAAVGLLALGYGIWEWRSELGTGMGKLRRFISKRP